MSKEKQSYAYAFLAVIILMALCIKPAEAATTPADSYITLGFGSENTFNVEVGTKREDSFGVFLGFGFSFDDPRKGENGESYWTKWEDVYKTGEGERSVMNMYVGTSYTIGGKLVDHSFGIGGEVAMMQEYTNWKDADGLLGDGGKFYLDHGTSADWGGVANYNAHFNNGLTLGVMYRTVNQEVVGSIGWNF
ncbi:hypothetical protein [Vibrio sp. WXL210]|uniref:hypothetical protein n=1 Tax=Vibrio sp. WXL210 TaxID=3450709 RepID=UPI003EC8F65A